MMCVRIPPLQCNTCRHPNPKGAPAAAAGAGSARCCQRHGYLERCFSSGSELAVDSPAAVVMRAQCEPLRAQPQPPLPTMTCHPNPKGAPAAAAGAGRARCESMFVFCGASAPACCVACWLQWLCVHSVLASLLACSRLRMNVPVIKTHPAFPPLCVSHWPQQKAIH